VLRYIFRNWRADVKHPMKDEARNIMHRRAQLAEGALDRSRFWVERIYEWAVENRDGYLMAISREALRQMDYKNSNKDTSDEQQR